VGPLHWLHFDDGTRPSLRFGFNGWAEGSREVVVRTLLVMSLLYHIVAASRRSAIEQMLRSCRRALWALEPSAACTEFALAKVEGSFGLMVSGVVEWAADGSRGER